MQMSERAHSYLLCLSCFIVTFLTPCIALAAYGLPSTAAAFGGAFGTLDPGLTSHCGNTNNLTNSCSCPGATQPSFQFRVIKDNWGGWNTFCSSGSPTSLSEFTGGYQIDDPVAGGQGCRVANANTNACSCPSGSTGVSIRNLTDSSNGIIGSYSVICMRVVSSPASFGGAYQQDDNVPGTAHCRQVNPYTGSCTCPSGFNPQSLRVEVDTYAGFIGSYAVTCAPPLQQVQICPSVDAGAIADPSGEVAADSAIQRCIDASSQGSVLEIPAGTYRVERQIVISKPLTFRTKDTAGVQSSCLGSVPCLTIQASPSFYVQGGMFALRNANGIALEHVVISGNRSMRIGSAADNACATLNSWGFNAVAQSCTNCSFKKSASIAALCGTGFEWDANSSGAVIQNSIFAGNGQNPGDLVSDGLTIHTSDSAVITDNQFIDNSDIGLILGGGTNAIVTGNYISQNAMTAYAGLMLDNFNGGTSGNFTGSVISGNTIICNTCTFAVNLGPHAWYLSQNIQGGSVINNYIRGGYIPLNVDGAGTGTNPIKVQGNDIDWYCNWYCSFNVSFDSVLTGDSDAPGSRQYTHDWF